MNTRVLTRKERYNLKEVQYLNNLSLVSINFRCDGNLGFLIRTAVCFGIKNLFVIGSLPERKLLNKLSGSTLDYVDIKCFKNTREFIDFTKEKKISIVSAELCEKARDLSTYQFNTKENTCIVVGNEELGVPGEIIAASKDVVFINHRGAGYVLNTSQAANIVVYEYSSQYWSN